MNRESFIDGDKTILNTDYYLYLLSCEEKENKLIKYLEDKIKELKDKNKNNNFGLDIVSTKGRIMAYQDILERVKSGKYE